MTFNQSVGIGLLMLCGVLASACDSPPGRQKFADITFQHRAPFVLDIGSVQLEQMPPAPAAAGSEEVSGEFPQAPAAAVAQWVRDRLQAGGARGQANVTIVEARAIRTPLPRSTGLNSALRTDQSDRYDLALEVRIEAFNPILGKSGTVSERVTRSQTVLENLTLNQREVVLYNMLDAAMKDLDTRLDAGIRQYLGPLIR